MFFRDGGVERAWIASDDFFKTCAGDLGDLAGSGAEVVSEVSVIAVALVVVRNRCGSRREGSRGVGWWCIRSNRIGHRIRRGWGLLARSWLRVLGFFHKINGG